MLYFNTLIYYFHLNYTKNPKLPEDEYLCIPEASSLYYP